MTASGAVPQKIWFSRLLYSSALLLLCVEVLVSACHDKTGNQYINFGTLWASGNAANHGLNPFAGYPESYMCDFTPYGYPIHFQDLNLNPPWTLPFIQALSLLPLNRFAQVWSILTGICLMAGCVILILRQPELQKRQLLWFALCSPTFGIIFSGQVYAWPFLFGVLAWAFYRAGSILAAGIALGGVIAVRPTMGFLLCVLFLSGYRKIAAIAFATVFALFVMPLAIYGPTIYVEWLKAFAGDQHWKASIDIAIMPSLKRLGHPHIGTAVAALVVVFAFVWAWTKKPDFINACGVGLCLGILCAPLAWFHYILFVAPFFMARKWTPLQTVAAGMFLLDWAISDMAFGVTSLIATTLILISFTTSAASLAKANQEAYSMVTTPG